MTDTRMAIFDDGRGRWGPLSDRRAIFDLRTGAHTTRQRIERVIGRAEALLVPAHLAAVCAERDATRGVNPVLEESEQWLLINGRCADIDDALAQRIAALPRGGALIEASGDVVAARLASPDARRFVDAGYDAQAVSVSAEPIGRDVLLARPWHVLDALEATLVADLEASDLPDWRDPARRATLDASVRLDEAQEAQAVRVAEDATVHPMVVFLNQRGPVVVDRGARIDPFAVLEGPCYIGAHAQVVSHTNVRGGTSIGPWCKVGGEIKHTVIQGHSNKAHLGYLGDSIVGEWVNLGADTNVSNLKNTYGPVRVALERDGPAEDTQRVNHGPIIGDLVRTAIGTRLLTGSVVGTGCMLALSGLAPKHLGAFAFCTDTGTLVHELDALLGTARRMMGRHGIELSESEAALLRELHSRATARTA